MNQTPLIQVRVLYFDGTPAANVHFSLRPMDGSDYRVLHGRYDFGSGVYTFVAEDFPPGLYMLRIEAPDYELIEKKIEVRDAGYSNDVFLVDADTECVKVGGRRVYFRRRPELIGVLHFDHKKAGAVRDRLDAGKLSGAALLHAEPRRVILEAGPHNAQSARSAVMLREALLGEFSDVVITDQGIEVVGERIEFLSRRVLVDLEKGVTWEDVRQDLGLDYVRLLYRDPYAPSIYVLEVESDEPYAVLDVVYLLLQHPMVRMCEPQMEGVIELTAPVLPSDLLRPWQWHLGTLRLPEAWELLRNINANLTFGSADVVLGVHDTGIETSGGGAVQHPDLTGSIAGGTLSAYLGNNNKVYYLYDFSRAPGAVMVRDNDNFAADRHGIQVAGVSTAKSDGVTGVVGTAPNARLASFLMKPSTAYGTNHFQFMAGINPAWAPGGLYNAAEPFPALFRTGGNAGPAPSVINFSHTWPPAADILFRDALTRITLLGRDRRGTVMVAAAGNSDTDTRLFSQWGNDLNVLKVAASSLDHRGYEILSNYSAHSVMTDPGIDVCAPSSNHWNSLHNPPKYYGVVSDYQVGIGGGNSVPGTNINQGTILNNPPVGGNFLTLSPADLVKFPVGTQVLIVDPVNGEKVEHNTITAPPGGAPPNSIGLATPLDLDFPANSRLITGALDYTDSFGGTSAATPMVSGIAVLMLTANSKLTWAEVRQILRDTSVPIGLRFVGPGPGRDKRWVDPAGADVIDADGVMVVPVGAPSRTIATVLNKGTTQITVANANMFQPRQAITIGAESKLAAATDPTGVAAPANQLTVVRGDDFERGDAIYIGKLIETVIENTVPLTPAPGTGIVLQVVNPDGFIVGDILDVGGQQVTLMAINTIAGGLSSNNARIIFQVNTVGGVAFNPAAAGTLVRIGAAQREGPFTITGKAGNQLTLNASVTRIHPANRIVQKENTEVAVVKHIATATKLEVYPLVNSHALNNVPGNLHITGGRIAFYSHGFGYGRVDAYEAVKAAINYTHNDRDMMIRNFVGDDGVANRAAQPVSSPDLWVTNDAPTPPGLAYGTAGPHQNPRVDIATPMFIGSGLNDLSAGGTFTGPGVITYVIEITATGATDTFTWRIDGGAASAGIAVSGAAQAIDANGLSITFNAITGHTVGDTWYIRCENIANRFVHLRIRNRGTSATFGSSGAGGWVAPPYQYRIFLCLSDGSPVARYYPPPGGGGLDDLRAVSDYTGATKDIITIRITALGVADQFIWAKGAGAFSAPIAITGAPQALSDGVSIQFDAVTGHALGSTWVLKCYPAAQKFMNIDHLIETNPAAAPFALSSNRPGTWLLTDPNLNPPPVASPAHYSLPVYAAGQDGYYSIAWPENNRPSRNGFGVAPLARPLRMFVMGEVTPHDGKLAGDIAEQDNNFSYREILFARFGFKKGNPVEEIADYIEVDSFGTVVNENFIVQVISDVSTFKAESVKIEFRITLDNGATQTKIFEYSGGNWGFTGGAPAWIAMPNPPRLADGATTAAGEQYYMTFSGTLNVSRQYKGIRITPRIYSAITPAVVLAEESNTVAVYEQALLSSSRYTGASPADLVPHSHFFTDIGTALSAQGDVLAYGPVISGVPADRQNKFRVTSLFSAPADVNAYAIVDGLLMIQRVANPAVPGTYLPNVVNLVLKPYKQAMLGFTPVKYFVYRNLRLDNFLMGTSAIDEKLVRPQAGANAYIQSLWALHTAQNGAVPFESAALGYDLANQPGGGKIDKLFYRQDPSKQLPFVARGTNIGKFFTNAGADPFGIEIILEERDFQPDFDYARKYKEIIIEKPVPPVGTPPAEADFIIRLGREKILNYIDPAAFFGMHMSKDGWLQVDNGAGTKTKYKGVDIYNNVISKFYTRNTLYIDIRNENGLSLNFYGKYNDGAGKALEVGNTSGGLTAQAYASDEWPILIRPSASMATTQTLNHVYLRLRRDYNHKPILYIEHGSTDKGTDGKPINTGRFVADERLIAPAASTTNVLGFNYPNKDLGSGNRIGVAWMIKLQYTMRQDMANSPFPPEVVPTGSYLDNLFGPADASPLWAVTDPVIAWTSAKDKKYVDGQGMAYLGFEHMADRGIAFSQWNGSVTTAGTVLFYAAAKDSFANGSKKFVAQSGMADGISKRSTFFDEPMLFGGYTVGFDVITDGGIDVLTMHLQEVPGSGRPAEAMLLLGLSRNELETHLKPITGFDSRYPRTIVLQEEAGSPFTDVNGGQYRKYKVGLRGMKSDGTAYQAFPGTSVYVYSVDRTFFFSHAFTQAQPVPTTYLRNYEEGFGAQQRPGITYQISAASGTTVTVPGKNLTREIAPGDKVRIKTSDYTVSTVAYSGGNSVITLGTSPGTVTPGTHTVRGPNKNYEDYYIAKDRLGTLSGLDRMEVLVGDFITAVNAVPDNAGTAAAIEALINTHAPRILQRARLICNDSTFGYADDRILYWARIKMMVAMKSHSYLLKFLRQRNRLVKLFETKSRGYDSVSFAAAGGRKKVLITGYDPFGLARNIKQSNPSGAAVLAMHGQNFTDGTRNIHVQTAIFPVRYADFDQNPAPGAGTGVVENFFERFMNSGHSDYVAGDVPDIIVTLSQGGAFEFWLERFAGRRRSGGDDNLNVGKIPFPGTVSGDQFYETTLPDQKIVPNGNAAGVFKVFYNNIFRYYWFNDDREIMFGDYLPPERPDGSHIQPNTKLKIEDPSHPQHSRLHGPVPTALTSTTTPKKSQIMSIIGSGGSYLSNEIYYRVSRLRTIHNPVMVTGHYHVPLIQHGPGGKVKSSAVNPAVKSTEDFSPGTTKQLIEEIRNALLRAFS